MNGRKMIGGLAMAAAITGGAAFGAIAGSPLVSGAQEDTSTTAPDTAPAEDAGARHGGPGLRGMKVEAAAEAIGISEEDLRSALKEGQTLTQVAEANGVDRQTVVDALVAAGNAQLDELRASLPERMDELMDKTRPEDGEGRRGRLRERLGN